MPDDRVLFSGAAMAPLPAHQRDRQLVARANELMYELTTFYPAISGVPPEWAWETIHYGSPDGLPVVGPHRNFPRHLFALGHGRSRRRRRLARGQAVAPRLPGRAGEGG